jgi:ABC-2 type transport system permease protein/oleandomycin transport system permease protein
MSTFALTAPLRPHVGVGPSIRQALVLTRRSLLRIKTNPEELIGLTLMPVMFLVLFTYVFGGAIAGSPGAYLQYALPGIVVQGVFFSTMYTGYGLNTDIKVGIFDRFRSLPIARSAPLIGQVLGDLVRYAMGIAITLGAGVALGFRIHTGPLQTLAAFGALVAAAFAFSWGYTLLGLVARSAVVIQAAGTMVIFPLTFASSVFVPARTLPGWLHAWAQISPVTLLADTTRGLLLGGHVVQPALQTLAWAVAVVLVFAPLSVRAYRRQV